MKFQTKDYHSSKTSNVAGQSFQVSMTAKFFETLFSGLYRYKDAAVIRELFCNAVDTHNARDRLYRIVPSHYNAVGYAQRNVVNEWLAPLNTPIEIHLPDSLEPWLEIKDFGMGLSIEQIIGSPITAREGELLIEGNIIVQEEEIPEGKGVIGEPGWYGGIMVFRSPDNNEIIRSAGLYTTLFESTKADSNDDIGAYGLGSKSPFAVTDTFTVESRFNGELHNFIMFLNDKRIPTVELATKDLDSRDPEPLPTDEPNGLTIRVPIKTSAYRAYADQLSDLCRVLLPHQYPVVTNDYYFSGFTPIDRSRQFGDTFIQENMRSSHASTHYAVMGGVAYPIELSQLEEDPRSLLERFPATYTFFDLGALNVPPSREDLSYDSFTLANLNEKMNSLRVSVMESAMGEIRAAQARGPLWLAVVKGDYSRMYGEGFKNLLNRTFPQDPRFHDGYVNLPSIEANVDFSLPEVQAMDNYNFMIGQGTKSFLTINRFTFSGRYDDERFKISDLTTYMKEGLKPVVIIMDNVRCFSQKIKQFISKNPVVKTVWLVTPNTSMLAWRNLDLHLQYSNHAEIKSELVKWIGDNKAIDYLRFADQFCEHYEGLINPEVKFTSELPYDQLKITGDIGMQRYMSYRQKRHSSQKSIEGCSFPSESILKVAEEGERMVYVEYSGFDMVHEGMTPYKAHLFQEAINKIRMKSGDGTVSELFYKKMGWHKNIVLVRRKAVPFLKQNPAFFVDINEAIKQMEAELRGIINGMEYGSFSGLAKETRFASANIAYHQWIMKQLGADAEVSHELYPLFLQSQKLLVSLKKTSKYAGECDTSFKQAVSEFGETQFKKSSDGLSAARELLTKIFGYTNMDDEYDHARQVLPQFERMETKLADYLGVNSMVFSQNKTKVVDRYDRKQKRYVHQNKNLESRLIVRQAIEFRRLMTFVNTQYQPTMGNKLGGSDAMLKTLTDTITNTVKFKR